jgi:O-antigen/teichoic acid export membrane protein
MSADKGFRRSVGWLFLGNTGTQILTFAFGLVLARLLAPAEFGMLVTIQVFTGMAGFISGGGMGQALVRSKDATRADYDVVFTLQILIGIAIYAAFFFAAPWFARWYDMPLYEQLLRVSALTFITRPLVNLPNSILHREMRFKAQTFARVLTLIVSSSTSISLAWAGWSVWSLVLGGLAGSVANALTLSLIARWRPGLNFEFSRGRELARYGFLVSVNDIVVYMRNQVSNFVLGRTLGMSSVGLFNKSDSLVRMPNLFIVSSVYQVLFRALAREQHDDTKSRHMFLHSIRLVAVYTAPFYVLLHLLAEPMMHVLYGARWVEAAGPLSLLAIASPFLMVANLCGAVLAARNWLQRELKVQIILLLLTGAGTLAGLQYGLNGVAMALIVIAAYNAAHMYWLAARCLGTRWLELFGALAPAGLLAAVMLAVALPLDYFTHALPDLLRLLVVGGGSAMVYGLCFLFLPIRPLAHERLKWKARIPLLRAEPPK